MKAGADPFIGSGSVTNLLLLLCSCTPLDTNIYFNRSCFEFAYGAAAKILSADEALTAMSSSDAIRITILLIRLGISVNAKNSDGASPLELISQNLAVFEDNFGSLIHILISNGARPDEAPALQAIKSQFGTINSLIQTGIDAWNTKGILGTEEIDLKYRIIPFPPTRILCSYFSVL